MTTGRDADANDNGTMIIDCDVHPHINGPHDVFRYLSEAWQKRFDNKEFKMTARAMDRYPHPDGNSLRPDTVPPNGGLPASDPEFIRTHFLQPYGIDVALLLPIQGAAVNAWTDPEAASIFTAALNDYFIDEWASKFDEYYLAVTVNPHDPPAAAEEIRRHGDTKGVGAVWLPLINALAGSRYYHPVYDAAEECGLPVVFHPTGAEMSYLGVPCVAGGVPRTYAERHALFPQIGQSTLASLVFEGVFQRFPKLKVGLVEWGFAWMTPLMWRMDKEWRNFRYDTPWLTEPPSHYVREHVRLTTQPIDEPQPTSADLWKLMDMISLDEMLMFSSDYPHYDIDDPKIVLGRMPAEKREKVARSNALEFLGDKIAAAVA